MDDLNVQYPDPPGTSGHDSSSKRKSTDTTPGQPRAKRNRYIAQACNECKRRKIKCNGENPCLRCGNLSLECIYSPNCCSNNFKDSQEFKTMNGQVQFLSQQVDRLIRTLNEHGIHVSPDTYPAQDATGYPVQPPIQDQNQQDVFESAGSPSQLRTKLANYQVPNETEIPFDLPINGGGDGEIPIDKALEYSQPHGNGDTQGSAPIATMSVQAREDPIWSINLAGAERLFSVYEEEIGKMYPILEPQEIHQKGTFLFKFLAASKNSGLKEHFDDYPNAARDVNANITKMVIANALAAENGVPNEIGQRLFQSVLEVSEKRPWEQVDGSTQVLLTLIAIHHFQLEDEVQAYRTLALVARSCLEKGLHQSATYSQVFTTNGQRASALNLFWSVYTLDKQWSLATGQPPSIHDSILDSTLPKPDESNPYLAAMVKHGGWTAKIWHPSRAFTEPSQNLRMDFIALCDFQIADWMTNMHSGLIFDINMDDEQIHEADRGELHRQIQLRLNISQLRLFLYRPVVQSSLKTGEQHKLAQEAIGIAQEMVRIILRISQHSVVVHTHPVSFYHFIASAIATFLLAVCQRPIEFGHQVRREFEVCLEFVKGLGIKSAVANRVWKGVRSMSESIPSTSAAGSSLGSTARQALSAANDPHSSAAVAMAGLAGHTVDERAVFDSSKGAMGDAPRSGSQIAAELLKLFDTACEYGNVSGVADKDNLATVYKNDQEFIRITHDLF